MSTEVELELGEIKSHLLRIYVSKEELGYLRKC